MQTCCLSYLSLEGLNPEKSDGYRLAEAVEEEGSG